MVTPYSPVRSEQSARTRAVSVHPHQAEEAAWPQKDIFLQQGHGLFCIRRQILLFRFCFWAESPFSDSFLSLMDALLFVIPEPGGGGGTGDSSVVPGCLILVLQRHHNRGAVATGRRSGSVIHYQEHFIFLGSVETGMNRVSSYRNHENRSDGSPLQGPSRGTAGQITGFLYEYGN